MYGLSLLYGPNKIFFSLKKCSKTVQPVLSASGDALQRWSCCGGRHRFGAKLPAKRKRNVEPALVSGPSENAMAKAMAGCTKCHAIQKQNAIHGKNMNISWTIRKSMIINYHQLSSPLPGIRIGVFSFHDFLYRPGDDFARVGRQ